MDENDRHAEADDYGEHLGMNDDVVVYTAPLVLPITGPMIEDGAVAVCNGRVLHVGTRSWVLRVLADELDTPRQTRLRERRWKGLITPGLVNAHTHLQYTGMAEVGKKSYDTFRAWEEAFNTVYDAPQKKPWQRWAERGAHQLIQAGTTAAADVVSDMEAVGALKSCGLHGIAYWEVMDWENEDWSRKGAHTLLSQLAEAGKDRNIHLGISPHAPYSLATAPLMDLPDIARSLGMRLHIHLGETPIEGGEIPSSLSSLTSWEWKEQSWEGYRSLKKAGFGASAIQFVDQLGVLGPDVHIAHGVYASREDRRLLRQRGVSVALCPRSNRIVCSGRDAPVARYLEEGNLISVGTDSLSSSPSLDVLDDLALLYDMAVEQGYDHEDLAHRLIRAATLGGAEAMGLNCGSDRIGQINPGTRADLAFFDVPVDISSPHALEETLTRFVRTGAGTCRATVLSGELVYDSIWNV